MMRFLLIGLLLMSGCDAGVTSIRSADGGRKVIDCATSYISLSLPGSYTCEQFDKFQATEGDRYNGRIGGIFQAYDLYGRTNDGVRVSVAVGKALSNGFFTASTSPEQSIHSYNSTTTQGQNWGYLRRLGSGASAIDFSSGTLKCFSFLQYGGVAQGGYEHVTRGYFCAGRATAYSDDDMSSLINAVVVR